MNKRGLLHTALLAIGVVVIGLILIGGYVYLTQPVCGNGKLERGETAATCCADAACLGKATCGTNGCVDPTCDSCQYLKNHACVDYACCDDRNCPEDASCTNHKCVSFTCEGCARITNHDCVPYECCSDAKCGSGKKCMDHFCIDFACNACEYLSKGQCVKMACCSDAECDDNDTTTIDKCAAPGKPVSKCAHLTPEEAGIVIAPVVNESAPAGNVSSSNQTRLPCTKENNCCSLNEDCQYAWFTGGCYTPEYVTKRQQEAQAQGQQLGEAPPRENVTCTCENNKCITHG